MLASVRACRPYAINPVRPSQSRSPAQFPKDPGLAFPASEISLSPGPPKPLGFCRPFRWQKRMGSFLSLMGQLRCEARRICFFSSPVRATFQRVELQAGFGVVNKPFNAIRVGNLCATGIPGGCRSFWSQTCPSPSRWRHSVPCPKNSLGSRRSFHLPVRPHPPQKAHPQAPHGCLRELLASSLGTRDLFAALGRLFAQKLSCPNTLAAAYL